MLPVLLVLLFSMVTLSSIYFDQLHLQAAARNAARAGSVMISEACTVAKSDLASNDIGAHTCDVVSDCSAGEVTIMLAASKTYSIPLLGDRTVNLDAKSSFVCAKSSGV